MVKLICALWIRFMIFLRILEPPISKEELAEQRRERRRSLETDINLNLAENLLLRGSITDLTVEISAANTKAKKALVDAHQEEVKDALVDVNVLMCERETAKANIEGNLVRVRDLRAELGDLIDTGTIAPEKAKPAPTKPVASMAEVMQHMKERDQSGRGVKGRSDIDPMEEFRKLQARKAAEAKAVKTEE